MKSRCFASQFRYLFQSPVRFVIAGMLLWSTPAARAEVIRSFDADVRLLPDTTLDVTETIQYDFESAYRHGIFRDIPVRYTRNGNGYTVDLRIKSVTKDNGERWNFTTSRQWNDLRVKIGDAERTITGPHTYVIHYTVRRAVNFFDGKPEVYWNATGNEWDVTMQQVTARFTPPPGVSIKSVRTMSFVGPLDSKTPAQSTVRQDDVLFYTNNLPAKSGLTFVAGLPAGSVVAPTPTQNILWFLADWWPVILFPIFTLSLVVTQWQRSGRDVDRGLPIAVEWSPPKDLSPAEVGTLVDERCDMADIVSTLVDLAARGYLQIHETSSEKFLFFSSKDYTFVRNNPSPDTSELLPHELSFLNALFSHSTSSYSGFGSQWHDSAGGSLQQESVTLSSLKNKFYTHLPGIRNSIYESLTRKHMFNGNPETVRNTYYVIGALVAGAGVVGIFVGFNMGAAAYGVGLLLAGIIVLLSARAMPSKTATGSRRLRECLGFQRFVQMAEKDRIAVLAKDDPTIFGRLLPYAMVLGVADQWADAFKDLLSTPPDWYYPSGYGPGYHFSSTAFVNDLGSGMNTMGNTFSSAPSSSGGSGGSGFSGGGSGGGFGGGGGGSW